MYKNSEGYNDPTAGEAMGKLTGEEKRHVLTDARRSEKEPPGSWTEYTGA